MSNLDEEPLLGIDRNRIKTVLREAYSACQEALGTEFNISEDDFVSKIDPYLECNRISTPVQLSLPSRNYPELIIEVNLRKKGVIARMSNRDKRIFLNRYLTVL